MAGCGHGRAGLSVKSAESGSRKAGWHWRVANGGSGQLCERTPSPRGPGALYRGGKHFGSLETAFPYCVPLIPARKGNVRERALVEMVQSVQHRVLLPLQDMTFFARAEMNQAIGFRVARDFLP